MIGVMKNRFIIRELMKFIEMDIGNVGDAEIRAAMEKQWSQCLLVTRGLREGLLTDGLHLMIFLLMVWKIGCWLMRAGKSQRIRLRYSV